MLCFPFIFRGALDVGATTVNEAMKLATRARARRPRDGRAVGHRRRTPTAIEDLRFGPEYLIPKPFDPRLIVMIAPAVAKAAMDSGVATRPIADFDAYRERLHAVRLSLRPADEADLRGGEEGPEADRLRRRRGRARAARRAGRRSTRASRSRSSSAGRRCSQRQVEKLRPAHPAGHRLRGRQSRVRPAVSRVLDRSTTALTAAQGRVAAVREDRDAPAAHADRRDDDPHGRGRRHAVRHVRHARAAPAVTSSR